MRLVISYSGVLGGAERALPFELLARARHEVVARRLGSRSARLDDSAQTLTFASRRLLKRALGREAERERRQLEAIRAVRRSP